MIKFTNGFLGQLSEETSQSAMRAIRYDPRLKGRIFPWTSQVAIRYACNKI